MARSTESRRESSGQPAPEQVLDRLDLTVLRRLDGLLHGDYRSAFRGSGLDFSDLRTYQPQDDIRHIDWNVTARMNTPFVRHYIEDRDLTAWFLLDRSASMAFGGDATKSQVLTDIVVSLARLITRGGNRVGALMWDNRVQSIIEPRSGRNQVLHLTREMTRDADGSAGRQGDPRAAGSATDLSALGTAAIAALRRRSLIFVVSDFVTAPGWERPFSLLALRHEVVALRIVDPAETELPNAGVMVMEDAETGEQLFVDTSDPGFRKRFTDAAEQRDADIEACARRAGMDLHVVSTGDDIVRAIVRIAERRKKQKR